MLLLWGDALCSVTASPAAGLETPQKGTAPEAPGMAQFSQIIQEEALASASRDTLRGTGSPLGAKEWNADKSKEHCRNKLCIVPKGPDRV